MPEKSGENIKKEISYKRNNDHSCIHLEITKDKQNTSIKLNYFTFLIKVSLTGWQLVVSLRQATPLMQT